MSIMHVKKKVETGGAVDLPGHQSNSLCGKRLGLKGAKQRVISRIVHLSPDFM